VKVTALKDLHAAGAPLAAEDLVLERVDVDQVFKLLVMVTLRAERERPPRARLHWQDVQRVTPPTPACDHQLLLGVLPKRRNSDRTPQAACTILSLARHPDEALTEDAEAPEASAGPISDPQAAVIVDAEACDACGLFSFTSKREASCERMSVEVEGVDVSGRLCRPDVERARGESEAAVHRRDTVSGSSAISP